ncbi:hypothetical protein [Glaciihabitans sp. UYNi722]|uniref:hypothetical protein n=1 Tax=Glaciihabitans sp. UYNi722 TaxID=3156344 RepID=UPI0033920FA1
MAELLDKLDRWKLHPSVVVTQQFPIGQASTAYEGADSGVLGKVGIVWSETS